MSRNKTPAMKGKLGRKLKQNRRVPLFVIAKTNRKVTQNVRRRSWRNQKMNLKE